MRFFDAMHDGLRRVEAGLDGLGGRMSPAYHRMRDGFGRPYMTSRRGGLWPILVLAEIAILVVIGAFLAPILLPAVLVMVIVFSAVLFARAWVREFAILMQAEDRAFPGHHDKLLWGLLLILAPPVGVWMFGSYREACWAEEKAADPVAEV